MGLQQPHRAQRRLHQMPSGSGPGTSVTKKDSTVTSYHGQTTYAYIHTLDFISIY